MLAVLTIPAAHLIAIMIVIAVVAVTFMVAVAVTMIPVVIVVTIVFVVAVPVVLGYSNCRGECQRQNGNRASPKPSFQ
jgi:fatty acid desaturase